MQDLTQEVVRELLHYDPETGIFTWRERDRKWFKDERSRKIWNTRFSGKMAGCETSKSNGYSYVQIRIFRKHYSAHRLAWIYINGSPTPEEIDHKNRNATDNRWNNLRASTRGHNSRNISMKTTNTSGATGVYWAKSRGKWESRVTLHGKNHFLGYFANKNDAIKAASSFRAKNGFDDCHGEELPHYIQ